MSKLFPTAHFRWSIYQKGDRYGEPTLQQKWCSHEEHEWRDVPYVLEQAPREELTGQDRAQAKKENPSDS